MYEWRQEYIDSVDRNGRDANGNARYILTLGMGGFTKRVTVAGTYSLTNGLVPGDQGLAWVYMNWDTGRAKYIMFKSPAEFPEFRRATMTHVRKVMEERDIPMIANALGVVSDALEMMRTSFRQHESVGSAYDELFRLVANIDSAGDMHTSDDPAMVNSIQAVTDYLVDMDKWWHDRLSERQVQALTTYRYGKLDYREQGFDWAK